jgi:hypothetical protein
MPDAEIEVGHGEHVVEADVDSAQGGAGRGWIRH